VYVKSLTPGGPAELQGQIRYGKCVCVCVCVYTHPSTITGDRLTSINGHSMSGKNRFEAVAYTRESLADVQLQFIRLKALINTSDEGRIQEPPTATTPTTAKTTTPNKLASAPKQIRQRARTDMSMWECLCVCVCVHPLYRIAGGSTDVPMFDSASILDEVRKKSQITTNTLDQRHRKARSDMEPNQLSQMIGSMVGCEDCEGGIIKRFSAC
jgi:hypothetical protein